ncbi:MAG: hypothetical protein ACRDXE_08230 [Acidimicrobiales bacterium]
MSPDPAALWRQAENETDGEADRRARYLELMREHGHIVAARPGEDRNLPCGWPENSPRTFIYIEGLRHELDSDEVTADQLRRLGSIRHDETVYRDDGDDLDPAVPEGTSKVRSGERFYSLPVGYVRRPAR